MKGAVAWRLGILIPSIIALYLWTCFETWQQRANNRPLQTFSAIYLAFIADRPHVDVADVTYLDPLFSFSATVSRSSTD